MGGIFSYVLVRTFNGWVEAAEEWLSDSGFSMTDEEMEKAGLVFLRDQAGLIPSEQFPDIAADLRVSGHDSTALRELVGYPRHGPWGARG